MNETPVYEVVVIGGGPAGLTTALYTTRLGHRTAIVNRAGGRYTTVNYVHNLIGISEETAGDELSQLAIDQIVECGADYYADTVRSIEERDDEPRFHVDASYADLRAERIVLATGFGDENPAIEGLHRFTGSGLHYCLHCDAYSLADESVYVLGHQAKAARIAMIMLNFTDDVDLLLNGEDPEWDEDVDEQVRAHPIEIVDEQVVEVIEREGPDGHPRLGPFEFTDGTKREYLGGFAVYGKQYHNDLATDLGCELHEDGSIAVDDNRETSVDGVYAVGDVTHGQNQTPIAMGDGAYAGIAVHRDLRTFPLSVEEARSVDPSDLDPPAMADDLRATMRLVRERPFHIGMTPPEEYR